MNHSDGDDFSGEQTGEQLIKYWSSTDDGKCHVIRSHRRPSYAPRARRLVVWTLAVVSSVGIVNTIAHRHSTENTADTNLTIAAMPDPDDGLTRREEQPPATRMVRGAHDDVDRDQTVFHRWVKPLKNYRVTSCFGPRRGREHKGIDFAASYGDTIQAVGDGVVVQSGWRFSGLGYSVVIDHGNGWMTLYGHASKLLVRTGQRVSAGQPVALVGSTGHSTGNHLHLGLARTRSLGQLFNSLVNPAPWLRDRVIPVGNCA